MSTAVWVSTNDYLSRSYRPDCELLDGQLVERNVGEYDHSNLQGALIMWLRNRQRDWNIRALPEQRLQVRADRFRIPDVCVISRSQPVEPIITKPPVLCIEVLSKDDTLRTMQQRIDDYLDFKVVNIWILDPVSRRAYICTREGFREAEDGILQASKSAIRLPLAELFSDLD